MGTLVVAGSGLEVHEHLTGADGDATDGRLGLGQVSPQEVLLEVGLVLDLDGIFVIRACGFELIGETELEIAIGVAPVVAVVGALEALAIADVVELGVVEFTHDAHPRAAAPLDVQIAASLVVRAGALDLRLLRDDRHERSSFV